MVSGGSVLEPPSHLDPTDSVRLLVDPSDGPDLQPGYVASACSQQPAMTPGSVREVVWSLISMNIYDFMMSMNIYDFMISMNIYDFMISMNIYEFMI